jgi:hypothetical protein
MLYVRIRTKITIQFFLLVIFTKRRWIESWQLKEKSAS